MYVVPRYPVPTGTVGQRCGILLRPLQTTTAVCLGALVTLLLAADAGRHEGGTRAQRGSLDEG